MFLNRVRSTFGPFALNDTGGPNASGGGGGGGGVPLAFGQIHEQGGGGGFLEFGQIHELVTLAFRHMRAELMSFPRCHSIYPSLLVTYLPCAHKVQSQKEGSSEPPPPPSPCVRPCQVKFEHVSLNSFSTMRVDLAVQVCGLGSE